MNLPEEVKQRIEEKASEVYPYSEWTPREFRDAQMSAYQAGATAEYLRGQSEIAQLKEDLIQARAPHYQMAFKRVEELKSKLQKRDELLKEMAGLLGYSVNHTFTEEEAIKVQDLLQKYSKSKEA